MQLPNREACYAIFRAKDPRFDGRLFVGVASTGVYCRPVCRARLPREENCTYFATAAQAEQAGYRPCLVCRPELAPGQAPLDAASALARRAARYLEEHCGDGLGLEEAARQLGCTSRHLRRSFWAEYQVTPVAYLQTCRLLLAKGLLTDTALPVVEVALAAGFGSQRRLEALFQSRYGLTPAALRRQAAAGSACPGRFTVALGYRPPYRWEELLGFLEARAIAGVERVADGRYWRTVRLAGRAGRQAAGWLSVGHRPDRCQLEVTLSESLAPALPQVLARVRRLFDLDCDPQAVGAVLEGMDRVRPGLYQPGRRVPGSFDPFETAVRAVLGQQITVKAASTLAGRLAAALGDPLETGVEGLTHTFPTPAALAALEDPPARLGPLGVTSARARCIAALAQAVEQGSLQLGPCADPAQAQAALLAIKGVGNWTAQYLAMRTLGEPDAFLETDVGVRRALPGFTPRQLRELAEAWRPWRSYAVINLWNAQ